MYSLGIILYELLAGDRPQATAGAISPPEPLPQVRQGLSEETYEFFFFSLSIDPDFRPVGQGVIWRLSGAVKAEKNNQRRRQYVAFIPWVGAALFVVLLLITIIFYARSRNTTPTPAEAATPVEAEILPVLPTMTNTPLTSPTAVEPTATSLVLPEPLTDTFPLLDSSPTATPTIDESNTPTATTTTTPSPTPTMAVTVTPTPSPTATSEPTTAACVRTPLPGWVSYVIQSGDSLFELSLLTNTTVEKLQEVNCLTDTTLSIGRTLWLPFNPAATAVPTENSSPPEPTDDGSSPPAASATPQPPPSATPPPPPPPPSATPPTP